MKPLAQLVRPNILALQPYSTARDEYAGGGIGVWLDANESPYDNGVNRYPDPHQRELKAQLAALKGVRSGQIFLGNGSDEAIDLAFRIFCEPGRDNAVSIAPTYGMYRVAAQTNDVELREVPLGADFSLPVEALLAAADGRTKLLWLCSPNNPTGNAFPDREIEELLRRFDGVVVLDEAYIDFAEGRGFLPRIDEFPNLIVLQTLSKAWGMAGLRLGLAFASERIAALFIAVPHCPDSFNVSHLPDNTGHFLQPGPRTTMMAAVARDDLIAVAVFFRADGGGGHNAVFLDRPHQIVHRLIVLHLKGVIPQGMEWMKL